MKQDPLFTSVQFVKGVGPKKKSLLKQLKIETIKDLLFYFPYRYEDRRHLKNIKDLKNGELQVFEAEVLAKGLRRSRRKISIFQLALGDETGRLEAIWFNQPYLNDSFKVGDKIIIYGKVQERKGLQVINPEYELIAEDEESDDFLHTKRIVPIYSLTKGISQRVLRKISYNALNEFLKYIEDNLPDNIKKKYNLVDLKRALSYIHFPQETEEITLARKRLVYEELFSLELVLAYKKYHYKFNEGSLRFNLDEEAIGAFIEKLPFELTLAQKKVINEIKNDLSSPCGMQRLLQGDVGSGKTVVALISALYVIACGYQVALMAPTEILAEQHYRTIKALLKGFKVKTALLISGIKKQEKNKVLENIKKQKADIIIGTHALIQKEVTFKKLGLVIIDEQHKFGVIQRQRLYKKGENPDLLIMTATPIPRTLAYSLYGDLDVSTIDALPGGRKKITTWWVTKKKIVGAYDFIKKEIKKGRQGYIVYPLVEKSKKLELKAAKEMYEHLSRDIFSEYKLGLIHGQMKADEKDKVMQQFKKGKIDILISTIVIEVGIDVANASVMLIEHAERFGLSQLHQLRGRIGRGEYESYCILVSSVLSDIAKKRLSVMSRLTSGFKIAEEDLILRGPGEFFGIEQHGFKDLKLADLIRDEAVLKKAREDAFEFLAKENFLESPLGRKLYLAYIKGRI
jgi:ATP-dependent DNA helicase RecG